MKTKLVLWGTNAQDEKILIAMELKAKENKVNIFTFPEAIATEEFSQQLMQDWRNNTEVAFPEGHQVIERELTISESLLPEDIRVERTDVVNRAQTEWHFIVLSSKLNEVYENELGELKEKVDQLTSYSSDVWEELKGFWTKVQGQVRERNLFKDHANSLRDNTNTLFDQLKQLRAALDAEFQTVSQNAYDGFISTIDDIEHRVNNGQGKLSAIFDELKELQRNFRESKLTREHRSNVWEKLDATFKFVKQKRFGDNANNESSALDRLKRRYDGLINAIDKMQKSIDRDKGDLDFQDHKIATTDGQLESQIRQAKIKMIEERIRSKEEKLAEMHKTKTELEQRLEGLRQKEAKRQERAEVEKARKAAKEKIAEKIKKDEAARLADTKNVEKLEKAAEAIGTKKVAEVAAPVVAAAAVVTGAKEVVETVVATETVAKETSTSELIANAVDTAVGVSEKSNGEATAETASSEEE